jgi:putative hydrolase of the HAD superfamily
MTQFVLFDLDNTLFDRQAAYARWAQSFVAKRGLGADAVDVLREVDRDGFATRHAVFDAARRRMHLQDSIEELIAEYRADYQGHFEPDEDVLLALRRLRTQRIRVGLVTNGPETQNEKIAKIGLLPLLDGCCVSEEFGYEKPDPKIFQEAIRRCGVDTFAGTGWMVGDSPEHDIAGGRGAGLRTVWIARGRTWTEDEFRPDLIASNITDAVDRVLLTKPRSTA